MLTSAGFEDMDGNKKANIFGCFRKMLGMPVTEVKVLFIPTAAIDDEARKMIDLCREELIHIGILPGNITIYELDGSLCVDSAVAYDAIYFTGGNTGHLLQKIREIGFDEIVKKMFYANKVYVGVSAGSIIATPNIGNPFEKSTAELCLVNAYLSVHCPEGTQARK